LRFNVLEVAIVVDVLGLQIRIVILADVLAHLNDYVETQPIRAGRAGKSIEVEVGGRKARNALLPIEERSVNLAILKKTIIERYFANEVSIADEVAVDEGVGWA
jgi:hypothetical protein